MRLVRWRPANSNYSPALRDSFFSTDPFFKVFEDWFSYAPASGVNVDIVENEGNYTLSAEVPGIDKKDLKVTVENDTLTIEAEKRNSYENEKDGHYHSERTYGKLSRSFKLNGQVDAEKIDAAYKDGVLTLTLPKREEVKSREVTVKVK
jgi:HSP20 family protein